MAAAVFGQTVCRMTFWSSLCMSETDWENLQHLLMIIPMSPISPSLHGLWIFDSCLRKSFLTKGSYLNPLIFSPPFSIWDLTHQAYPIGDWSSSWCLGTPLRHLCAHAVTSASRLFAARRDQTVLISTDSSVMPRRPAFQRTMTGFRLESPGVLVSAVFKFPQL